MTGDSTKRTPGLALCGPSFPHKTGVARLAPPGGPQVSSKNESPGLHLDQASGSLSTSPKVSSWILEDLVRDKVTCFGGVPTFPVLSWQVLWDHTGL